LPPHSKVSAQPLRFAALTTFYGCTEDGGWKGPESVKGQLSSAQYSGYPHNTLLWI